MPKRFILSEKNIPGYLLKTVDKDTEMNIKKVGAVREITKYTNSSFVFKANCLTDSGRQIVYLKYSGDYNKRGKEFRTEPVRTVVEGEKIKLLKILLEPGLVPHIVYIDYKNLVMVSLDIQGNKKILVEEFDQDKVYPGLAGKFGEFFGTLHGKTYNTPAVFNDTAWQRRIYNKWPDWLMTGPSQHLPKKTISQFLRQSEKATKALVWGDPVSRNIFVDNRSFSVLDFDFTMHFDPAMDPGMFLAQWAMKMLENKKKVATDCQLFIKRFLKSYSTTLKQYQVPLKEINDILKRAEIWIGVYMVSRTDGESGSYFEKWPDWEEKIRKTGLALISGQSEQAANQLRRYFR